MRSFIASIYFLLFFSVYAQDEGAIRFVIPDSTVNEYSNEKVELFFVKNIDTNPGVTDTVSFLLEDHKTLIYLPGGIYTLTVKSNFFDELEISEIVISSEKVTFLNLELNKIIEKQKKVRVKYNKPESSNCH
jgi:hypothetical protein